MHAALTFRDFRRLGPFVTGAFTYRVLGATPVCIHARTDAP